MNYFKYLTLVTIALLELSGCAFRYVMLDQAIIQNDTPDMLTDVRVIHEPTNKMGQVNAILPRRSLNLGFAGQPMLGRRAVVSWKDRSGKSRESQLTLPKDRKAALSGRPMKLVYTIHPAGRVTVRLEDAEK